MTNRSRVEVEEQARRLLDGQSVESAPVPVQRLAESLGYRVIFRYFNDGDLSGTVIQDAHKSVTIGINTLHASVRQRFSIAHEIGHALMHLGKGEDLIVDPPTRSLFNRDGRASLGEDPREIEANQFAAELLMPRYLIAQVAEELLGKSSQFSTGSLVNALAQRFDVSSQAMKFRLVNLGVIEPE